MDNRGIFLASVAGLAALLTAWGSGYYLAALNYPDQERYQTYRYAADKPADIYSAWPARIDTKPNEYRAPCDKPKGRDESDLCAQWRAAKAGEISAFWTKWSVIVGFGGMIGLFWTLYYTRKAVEDMVLDCPLDDFDYRDLFGGPDGKTLLTLGPGTQKYHVSVNIPWDRIDVTKIHLFYGWIEYDDIVGSGKRHRTEFCYRIVGGSDETGNPVDLQQIGPFNGMDECCYRKPQTK